MILQLEPGMFVDTPLGKGIPLAIINCNAHKKMCWIVRIMETNVEEHFDSKDVFFSSEFNFNLPDNHE